MGIQVPEFALSDDQIEFASLAAANGSILSQDVATICKFAKSAKLLLMAQVVAQIVNARSDNLMLQLFVESIGVAMASSESNEEKVNAMSEVITWMSSLIEMEAQTIDSMAELDWPQFDDSDIQDAVGVVYLNSDDPDVESLATPGSDSLPSIDNTQSFEPSMTVRHHSDGNFEIEICTSDGDGMSVTLTRDGAEMLAVHLTERLKGTTE